MNRKEIILAGLTPGSGELYSPVQVQKLFFLIDRTIPKEVGGPLFNFQPYNYGPFDKAVYETLESLVKEELVEIIPCQNWKEYRLTAQGREQGQKIYDTLPGNLKKYLSELSSFVRSLSFTQLVSAIYKAYPEMKANSVFQE